MQDLEYWIYSQNTLEGVLDTSNPPSPINLDWTRVYNVPLDLTGNSSTVTNEGAIAIYQKAGSQFQLINYYTVPNSATDRRLGHQLKFRQTGTDSYKLYVHAKGNSSETNEGRIYIFDKNATDNWALGIENKYRGLFKNTLSYFIGDLVRVGDIIYEANTNLVPNVFLASQWTAKTEGVDLLGLSLIHI